MKGTCFRLTAAVLSSDQLNFSLRDNVKTEDNFSMNFLVMVTKDITEKNLRDEKLNLTHGIAGFSQWFLGPM